MASRVAASAKMEKVRELAQVDFATMQRLTHEEVVRAGHVRAGEGKRVVDSLGKAVEEFSSVLSTPYHELPSTTEGSVKSEKGYGTEIEVEETQHSLFSGVSGKLVQQAKSEGGEGVHQGLSSMGVSPLFDLKTFPKGLVVSQPKVLGA